MIVAVFDSYVFHNLCCCDCESGKCKLLFVYLVRLLILTSRKFHFIQFSRYYQVLKVMQT